MPDHHPLAPMSEAWGFSWQLERPVSPTPSDLLDLLEEIGILAQRERWRGPMREEQDLDQAEHVMRVSLCFPISREGEVREFLKSRPASTHRPLSTILWDVALRDEGSPRAESSFGLRCSRLTISISIHFVAVVQSLVQDKSAKDGGNDPSVYSKCDEREAKSDQDCGENVAMPGFRIDQHLSQDSPHTVHVPNPFLTGQFVSTRSYEMATQSNGAKGSRRLGEQIALFR